MGVSFQRRRLPQKIKGKINRPIRKDDLPLEWTHKNSLPNCNFEESAGKLIVRGPNREAK